MKSLYFGLTTLLYTVWASLAILHVVGSNTIQHSILFEQITRPLPIIPLFLHTLTRIPLAISDSFIHVIWLLSLALGQIALCVGDTILMLTEEQMSKDLTLYIGFGCSVIGHAMLLISFTCKSTKGEKNLSLNLSTLLPFLPLLTVGILLLFTLPQVTLSLYLKLVIVGYALFMILAAWRCCARVKYKKENKIINSLAALGYNLFIISNLLFVIDRTIKEINQGSIWIMSLYYIAIAFISLSVDRRDAHKVYPCCVSKDEEYEKFAETELLISEDAFVKSWT